MSFLLGPTRRSASTIPSLARSFTSTRPTALARMTIVGRVGTDPELSEVASGAKMIRYVIGSNSGPRDNQTTSWFRVACFVPAESAKREEYFMGIGKGTLVYLEGDATMKTYEDGEGKKQSTLNIVQTKLEVLKRPRDAQGSDGGASGV